MLYYVQYVNEWRNVSLRKFKRGKLNVVDMISTQTHTWRCGMQMMIDTASYMISCVYWILLQSIIIVSMWVCVCAKEHFYCVSIVKMMHHECKIIKLILEAKKQLRIEFFFLVCFCKFILYCNWTLFFDWWYIVVNYRDASVCFFLNSVKFKAMVKKLFSFGLFLS